ncbi:MAG: hypothetical protein AAGJ54_03660 [Planctomycetota bacterium]
MNDQTKAAKPIDEVRLKGVRAAIWRNVTADGRTVYNATIERLYKNDQGDWKSSTSFGMNDFLLAAKVFDRVHTKIAAMEDRDRQERAANHAERGSR